MIRARTNLRLCGELNDGRTANGEQGTFERTGAAALGTRRRSKSGQEKSQGYLEVVLKWRKCILPINPFPPVCERRARDGKY